MQILRRAWNPIWAVAGIIAGLMTIEIIEEPDMTPGQILMELAEPVLIVLAVAGVVHLLGRMQRQHLEQLSLMRDLDVARAEGAQWQADMRELLKGLGSAIDSQFDRWQLTAAEREIALLSQSQGDCARA